MMLSEFVKEINDLIETHGDRKIYVAHGDFENMLPIEKHQIDFALGHNVALLDLNMLLPNQQPIYKKLDIILEMLKIHKNVIANNIETGARESNVNWDKIVADFTKK